MFSHGDGAGRFGWWHGAEKTDEPGHATGPINKHALQFIEDHREEPCCLYVPHEAPHFPYHGPNDNPCGFRVAGGYSGRLQPSREAIKEENRSMVVSMDHGVGVILDVLRHWDLTERTLELFVY